MNSKVIVNEVFNIDGGVAIRVTDEETNLKTIKMKEEDYKSAFPSGIYENARLTVQKDSLGNITSVSPERWFPVTEANPTNKEPEDDRWTDIS